MKDIRVGATYLISKYERMSNIKEDLVSMVKHDLTLRLCKKIMERDDFFTERTDKDGNIIVSVNAYVLSESDYVDAIRATQRNTMQMMPSSFGGVW